MRIIIEYRPNISKVTRSLIETYVKPSMISPYESSKQYDIASAIHILTDIVNNQNDWKSNDIEELKKLRKEHNVEYIEF